MMKQVISRLGRNMTAYVTKKEYQTMQKGLFRSLSTKTTSELPQIPIVEDPKNPIFVQNIKDHEIDEEEDMTHGFDDDMFNESVDRELSRFDQHEGEYVPKPATGLLGKDSLLNALKSTDGVNRGQLLRKDQELSSIPPQNAKAMRPLKSAKRELKPEIQRRRQTRTGAAIEEFLQYLFATDASLVYPPYHLEVTKVDISRDLRQTTVFWALANSEMEFLARQTQPVRKCKAHLESKRKYLRARVGRHLNLRHTSVIFLQHDPTPESNYEFLPEEIEDEEEEEEEDESIPNPLNQSWTFPTK